MNNERLKDLRALLLIVVKDIDDVLEAIDDVIYPLGVDPDGEL